jgi:hypothetical protein
VAERVSALCEAWGLPEVSRALLGMESAEQKGTVVYYGENGQRCEVSEDFSDDEWREEVKTAATRAVVVHLGGGAAGTALLWVVKEKKHIKLAEKLHYEIIGDHRSTFQCLVGPSMELIAREAAAPPESWTQRIWSKVSDGGFAAAIMSFGALITFFTTAVASGVTSWMPLGISLALLFVGLLIGCLGQFLYRRSVAPEAA